MYGNRWYAHSECHKFSVLTTPVKIFCTAECLHLATFEPSLSRNTYYPSDSGTISFGGEGDSFYEYLIKLWYADPFGYAGSVLFQLFYRSNANPCLVR